MGLFALRAHPFGAALAGVIPASSLSWSTEPSRRKFRSRVAERVGLLAAGDGRSSSASLRTAAPRPRRPKIAPRFLSNPGGFVHAPRTPKNKKGPQSRPFFIFWRRGWDYSALRASPLRGRPSGRFPASLLSRSTDPDRTELMSRVAERVGFEPTCRNYPTIRFRVGAVMTTSVPLRLT